MKWWLVIIVAIACIVLMPRKTFEIMTRSENDNHSAERMKKVREAKKRKALARKAEAKMKIAA